jgi:hypothetical protein
MEMMNKRQARIEALKTVVGILEATDMGTFLCYLNDKDSAKAWAEFGRIKESLQKQWDRLETQ